MGKEKKRDGGVDFRHINNGRLNATLFDESTMSMTQPFYSEIAELNLLKFHRVAKKNVKLKLHARDVQAMTHVHVRLKLK